MELNLSQQGFTVSLIKQRHISKMLVIKCYYITHSAHTVHMSKHSMIHVFITVQVFHSTNNTCQEYFLVSFSNHANVSPCQQQILHMAIITDSIQRSSSKVEE